MLLGLALSAGAQMKMSGKLSCGKPDVNSSAEVGDVAGHMVMLQKVTCTWPTPFTIAGSNAVSAVDVGTAEARGGVATQHGYSTSTMDNGDKTTVAYTGNMHLNSDGSGTFNGTWKFISGTGKLQGIKGSGLYKGAAAADGTGAADIQGHYTIPASAKTSKKAK
jgi:hypothetical protein